MDGVHKPISDGTFYHTEKIARVHTRRMTSPAIIIISKR